jgi:protein-S-isoprenylcysteine O-methyltransferase Ste14
MTVSTSERRDNAGVIAPPPLIALAVLLIGLALDRLLPAYVLMVLLSLTERIVIGVMLMTAGGALGLSAILAFRAARTHVEPWKPTVALVTSGVFRWLRNPMYVGLALLVAGIGVALASDWTLVMLLPGAAILHYGVVRREERYLTAKFGEAYRRYCDAVPRYGWPV